MKTAPRLSLSAAVLAVAAVGVLVAFSPWAGLSSGEPGHLLHSFQASQPAPSLVSLTGSWRELEDAHQAEDELDSRLAAAQRRLETKQGILEELVAGRITLLQAGARFQALDRANPDFAWAMFRRFYQGNTDAERHCQQVIAHIGSVVTDTSMAAAVRERLEEDLQTYRSQGEVSFPAN
jgi:hypothetical protein